MTQINGIRQVEVADLDDEAVLLDVREPNEFEAGHAPGAVSIPLGDLRARLAEVPEGDLTVICRSGGRSQAAAEFLVRQGVPAVNVSGGTIAWALAGKPLVAEGDAKPSVVPPTTMPPESV